MIMIVFFAPDTIARVGGFIFFFLIILIISVALILYKQEKKTILRSPKWSWPFFHLRKWNLLILFGSELYEIFKEAYF